MELAQLDLFWEVEVQKWTGGCGPTRPVLATFDALLGDAIAIQTMDRYKTVHTKQE